MVVPSASNDRHLPAEDNMFKCWNIRHEVHTGLTGTRRLAKQSNLRDKLYSYYLRNKLQKAFVYSRRRINF